MAAGQDAQRITVLEQGLAALQRQLSRELSLRDQTIADLTDRVVALEPMPTPSPSPSPSPEP